ncbi:DUF3987 domain-containing protein [Corynebacterium variabile]|uniref:DUF3987 domain-containing protein n=1 Tax=Corynebacterium variabile TaxID=1727 RepID=UPI003FD5FB12
MTSTEITTSAQAREVLARHRPDRDTLLARLDFTPCHDRGGYMRGDDKAARDAEIRRGVAAGLTGRECSVVWRVNEGSVSVARRATDAVDTPAAVPEPMEPTPVPFTHDHPVQAPTSAESTPSVSPAKRLNDHPAPTGTPQPRKQPLTSTDVPRLTPVTVEEVFDGRASLRSIRDNARNAGEAPFAVLIAVIIRLLACTPPSLTLPGFGVRSAPGSLNLYGAVAAPSGGGKGEVMALAEHCMTIRDTHGQIVDLETFSIGSGEGLVSVFEMPDDPETMPTTRAMAEVDEITELTALSGRTGATLQPKLLSMWSGKAVGNRNRGKDTSQQVAAGRYRLTVLAGVQPGNAGELLNAEASTSGLPQRFIWASMEDKGFNPDTPAVDPVRIEVPAFDDPARNVKVCKEVWDALRADKARKRAGKYPHAWDSHAIQCTEILAVALSLLDGRDGDVNPEDWRLAGLLWQHNRDTRRACLAVCEGAAVEAAAARRITDAEARDQAADTITEKYTSTVRERVLRLLRESEFPVPHGTLNSALKGRPVSDGLSQRDRLPGVLEGLIEEGLIESSNAVDGHGDWTTEYVACPR